MAEIDSLVIDIVANSSKASSSLEGLANGLERMQGAVNSINGANLVTIANGIRDIANATAQISGIDKRSFTSLAEKFNALANIDAGKLDATALSLEKISTTFNGLSTVAQGNIGTIKDMVTALGTLGSAKVERATSQIPALGVALKELFTTLSDAPKVSNNVVQMTNALANLSTQGQKVGSATKTMTNSLKSTTFAIGGATRGFKGLASQIGLFYAKFFLIARGIKAIAKTISSSMEYVETFNYWNVALSKVQSDYAGDWERWSGELGVKSAEEYADSFESRLKELTRKMTGYNIGDSGELIATDSLGLAMNPKQLMEYQAKIMGITNSVGLLGESSVDTSKALSMLAGDLSSLTNTDMQSVMDNLQSGLIGQSRALYKYGIDITNATLQEYALANGITKKVSAMTQSEKMMLRMIAILDQSKVAWGDQANTINSVANQYRIFQQQISNLVRTIGNLFLPIVQKVLPYINALIIVLQRLFTLLGFKLYGDNWLAGLQDGISGGTNLSDDVGADDLSDDLGQATENAKKLKKQLQGFDELNNITQNEDSSGSGGAGGNFGVDLANALKNALKDYETVWNNALANMKNNATAIADKIWEVFERLANSKFGQSMEKLAGILKEILGYSFETLIDFYNEFLKPVASWIGNEVIARLVDLFERFVHKIKWKTVLDALKSVYKVLAKFTIGIGKGLFNVFEVLGKIALDVLAGLINAIASAIKFLADILNKVPEKVLVAIGGALAGILLQKGALALITKLTPAFTTLLTAVKGFFAGGNVLQKIATYLGGLVSPTTLVIAGVGALVSILIELKKELDESAQKTVAQALSFEKLQENCSKGVFSLEELSNAFIEKTQSISKSWSAMNDSFTELTTAKENITSTSDELSLLFTKIEVGKEDASKYIDEIVAKFEYLYNETQRVFDMEYDVILMGVAGSLSDTLVAMGISVEGVIEQLVKLKAGGDEQLAYMYEQYANAQREFDETKNADAYAQAILNITEQLTNLGLDGTVDTATQKLEEFAGALDISKFFDENGTFKADEYNAYIKGLADTYQAGLDEITSAGEEYEKSVDDFKAKLDQLGIDTSGFDWESLKQANRQSVEKAKADYEATFNEYVNVIEKGFSEQIPSVIEKAEEDYAKLKPLQKIGMRLFNSDSSQDAYIKKSLDTWISNVINPAFTTLGENFDTFGKEGSDQASATMQSIIDSLFDVKVVNKTETKTALKNEWQNILDDVADELDVTDTMKNVGTQSGGGLTQGIRDSEGNVKGATKTLTDAIVKTSREELDIHSPSKVMYEIGEFVVDGLNDGIDDSTDQTISLVSDWATSIKTKFGEYMSDYKQIGIDIAQGIIDGIDSMRTNVESKAREIAQIIKDALKDAIGQSVSDSIGKAKDNISKGADRISQTANRSFANMNMSNGISTPNNRTNMNNTNIAQSNNNSVNNRDLANMVNTAFVNAISQASSNTQVNVTLEGDAKGLFKSVQKSAQNYSYQTGRPAFI